MTVRRALLAGAVAAFVAPWSIQAQPSQQTSPAPPPPTPPATLRVLFIGNSYTYYNNLPKLVESIAAAQKDGPRIVTEAVLRGGERLKGHWDAGKALAAIQKGGWNYVVLQEYSALGGRTMPAGNAAITINDPAEYLDYARRFDAEIRKVGARTVLYQTWSREHQPEQQRRLDDAFSRAARDLGAGVVPVGLAWQIARIETPDMRLYQPDRSHPSATGSYLAALVFYLSLTGRAGVNDAPTLIMGPEWNTSRELALVSLSYSDKMALQMLAQRAVAEEPLRPVR